jgi:hypothetical protein
MRTISSNPSTTYFGIAGAREDIEADAHVIVIAMFNAAIGGVELCVAGTEAAQ